jgi:N-acetyltransferase
VQRTGLNTEAKLLLLGYAFETLRCAAVGLQTSWFNHASRTAIARLGAKQEGVTRNHVRHKDGTLRDTVNFSIIDAEWPAVKSNLQSRLARDPR